MKLAFMMALAFGTWQIGKTGRPPDPPAETEWVKMHVKAGQRIRFYDDATVYLKRDAYERAFPPQPPALKKKCVSTGQSSKIVQHDRRVVRRSAVFYSGDSRWTWPGDLRQHLQGPPHYMGRDFCLTASRRELITAHDRWHETH